MYPFQYQAPETIDEAVRLIAGNDEARVLAGGMTLLPTMKQRLAAPEVLVDLARIGELRGIREDGDSLVIGAMTTHAAVAGDARVRERIPALAFLARGIGDPQVRHRGTIGGSIANNDPASDYPAAVLGLGATVRTSRRSIPADEFFTGMFETALEPGELVTAVQFPVPEAAGYRKFPNPASRYPVAGVFVARRGGAVRVAVTGAASCVFREPGLESALAKHFSAEAIAAYRVDPSEFNEDLHASAEYRGQLVSAMAKRAVEQALG
jgi:carbon-monoxide dehydrogenase medium subunit